MGSFRVGLSLRSSSSAHSTAFMEGGGTVPEAVFEE